MLYKINTGYPPILIKKLKKKSMKNNIIWYLSLLLSILTIACTKQNSPFDHFKDKPVEKIYPINIVDLEEFGVLRPFNFVQIDDSMFVIQDEKAENIYNLINLSSKKVVSGVNKGQGPMDVIAPSELRYRNNEILVWDAMSKKMSELVFSSDTSLTIKEYFMVNTEILILYRTFLLNSTFLASGRSDEFWIAEMNKDGEIISVIDYPIRNETKDLPRTMLPTLYSTVIKMSNSPDGKRIVAATGRQGILCFINRSDSGIKVYKQLQYQAPNFTMDSRGGVVYTRDNIEGFGAVDCDDNYVYATYSGRTFNSHERSVSDCEHLLVYDWDGNPVKRYILDVPTFGNIHYNKEKNCIYGLTQDPEGLLIMYQL